MVRVCARIPGGEGGLRRAGDIGGQGIEGRVDMGPDVGLR
jgi:hypothetical protein